MIEMNTDVLMLAAGLGMRLRPLTENTPKPLIDVGGKPTLQWSLDKVVAAGFKRVIINSHYKAEQIREYVKTYFASDCEIVVVEEKDKLLDTGGAVKNIEDKWHTEDLLIYNSDTLFGGDFNPAAAVKFHQLQNPKPFATMVLRADPNAEDFGVLGIDEKGDVVTFRGEHLINHPVTKSLMYTGCMVLSRKILDFMPERGTVFSITRDTVRAVLEAQGRVCSFQYNGYWNDIGTLESLERARKMSTQGILEQ